jgi:hypothetical protein
MMEWINKFRSIFKKRAATFFSISSNQNRTRNRDFDSESGYVLESFGSKFRSIKSVVVHDSSLTVYVLDTKFLVLPDE